MAAVLIVILNKRKGKSKQKEVVEVECRAGGGLHRPKMQGWSAGDIENLPGKVTQNQKLDAFRATK